MNLQYNKEYFILDENIARSPDQSFADYWTHIQSLVPQDTKYVLLINHPVSLAEIKANYDKFRYLVNLSIKNQSCISRILSRRVHLPSGRRYSINNLEKSGQYTDEITNEPLTLLPKDNVAYVTYKLNEWELRFDSILNQLRQSDELKTKIKDLEVDRGFGEIMDDLSHIVEEQNIQENIKSIDQAIQENSKQLEQINNHLSEETDKKMELEMNLKIDKTTYQKLTIKEIHTIHKNVSFGLNVVLKKNSYFYGETLYRILQVFSLEMHQENNFNKIFYYHKIKLISFIPKDQLGESEIEFRLLDEDRSDYSIKGNQNVIHAIFDYLSDQIDYKDFVELMKNIASQGAIQYVTKKLENIHNKQELLQKKVKVRNFQEINSEYSGNFKNLIKTKINEYDTVATEHKQLIEKMLVLNKSIQNIQDIQNLKSNVNKLKTQNDEITEIHEILSEKHVKLSDDNESKAKTVESMSEEQKHLLKQYDVLDEEVKELQENLRRDNAEKIKLQNEVREKIGCYYDISELDAPEREDEYNYVHHNDSIQLSATGDEVADNGEMDSASKEDRERRGRTNSLDYVANQKEIDYYKQNL